MGDIFIHIIDMPCGVWGHCNCNADGSYSIFINARLSYEMQQQIYLHELMHINEMDFEKADVNEIEDEVRRRLNERTKKR